MLKRTLKAYLHIKHVCSIFWQNETVRQLVNIGSLYLTILLEETKKAKKMKLQTLCITR